MSCTDPEFAESMRRSPEQAMFGDRCPFNAAELEAASAPVIALKELAVRKHPTVHRALPATLDEALPLLPTKYDLVVAVKVPRLATDRLSALTAPHGLLIQTPPRGLSPLWGPESPQEPEGGSPCGPGVGRAERCPPDPR